MNNNNLLNALSQEGVLISVSVRYWRAVKKLKPEDLGLDPDSITDRLILLGHKKLLPKEALQSFALIEGRTHALVESNTFPFLGGLGHFLPNTKLVEITTQLKDLEEEFGDTKRSFVTRYSELREQAKAEWSEAAAKLVTTPEQSVAAISAAFPSVDRLNQRFAFETRLFQIRAPEGLQAQLITAADQAEIIQARQKTASEASASMAHELNQFLTDCIASMRQQTADLCSEMLTSISQSKSGVHQKTLNRLIRFIDQFKQLNFAGDRQMEEQLESVRKEFLSRTAQEYRDNRFAQAQLETGLSRLRESASQLAQQNSSEIVERFGQLGQRRIRFAS